MVISLNGEWKLTAFPQVAGAPDTPDAIERGGYFTCPASVPGDTVLDLVKACVIPDPYFGTNIFGLRKYESYRWMLRRSAFVPHLEGRAVLCFDGINTVAEVFVNGISVGKADNMLIPHEFDVTDALKSEEVNDFAVVISSALLESRKADYPVSVTMSEHTEELTRLRMPPSAFGWDILCRCISAGLWRGVRLESRVRPRITQVYYATVSASDNGYDSPTARVTCRYRFDTEDVDMSAYEVEIVGSFWDTECFRVKQPAFSPIGHADFTVENANLWWPAGYGEPSLYDVTFRLLKNGAAVDERKERIGLRTACVEYSDTPENKQFLVKVNNVPIFCRGSNWVPLDAFHSRDAEKYEEAVGQFADMGCNILRCWGGNVYEDDRFYALCDENGILVWQDFAMACAVYPQDTDFLARIEKEAETVIRLRRNHPCILLWAGDNEVDEAYCGLSYAPGNSYNAVTREALPRAVRTNDPYRFFLPSSPYIAAGSVRYQTPEQHNWGSRAYFKDDFYKNTKARFVSECGYHGCPNRESLEKFIPKDELWPITAGGSWDCHNTDDVVAHPRGYNRNDLMIRQAKVLAGEDITDLDEFITVSQFSQAEALKFFVERARIRAWQRTGVIWWNMRDGWPQISDAIVDWYGGKKLAYTWLKRIHVPTCLMLDEADDWKQKVIISNLCRETPLVKWQVADADTEEILAKGETLCRPNESMHVFTLRSVPGEKRLYILLWQIGEETFVNHYLTGFPPYDKQDLLRWADRIQNL